MLTRRRQSRAQVTIGRALSKLGLVSRSQAEELLASGRVTVNDSVVRDPGIWLDIRLDSIAVDGTVVARVKKRYLMMNKPAGIVTTRSDERGRKTVYDLLPAEDKSCNPVGRLDRDTSGLLLFTSDTGFGEFVTNPSTKMPKEYDVLLDATLDETGIHRLESGMTIRDGTHYLPARVRKLSGVPRYRVTITEGKNRQIRRMMQALDRSVIALARVRIGPLELGDLPAGAVRVLTIDELTSLGWHV